jgi:hypothetical protein
VLWRPSRTTRGRYSATGTENRVFDALVLRDGASISAVAEIDFTKAKSGRPDLAAPLQDEAFGTYLLSQNDSLIHRSFLSRHKVASERPLRTAEATRIAFNAAGSQSTRIRQSSAKISSGKSSLRAGCTKKVPLAWPLPSAYRPSHRSSFERNSAAFLDNEIARSPGGKLGVLIGASFHEASLVEQSFAEMAVVFEN